MLPRLLGLVTVLVVLIALVRALAQTFGRPRHPHAHRPRNGASAGRGLGDLFADLFGRPGHSPRPPDAAQPGAPHTGAIHLVNRAELAGVRDAFSSAPLDSSQPLYRCEGCASFYQAPSLQAISRENGGHCVVCHGTRLGSVRLIDP